MGFIFNGKKYLFFHKLFKGLKFSKQGQKPNFVLKNPYQKVEQECNKCNLIKHKKNYKIVFFAI